MKELLGLAALLASAVALAQPPTRHAAQTSSGARYAKYVERWHAPSEEPILVDDAGRPELVLFALNTSEHIELRAATDRGGFAASDLDRAAWALRDTQSGNACPVEPRLLDLVYGIETHFQAREIRFLSGYRTPRRGSGSNHGKGRAMDLLVPGTADAEVAKYARSLGFVGVGIYPTSGFVHVDVRDRSYFWSDASGPGKRNRERGILGDLAIASDKAAVARGEAPVAPFSVSFDVDSALRARGLLPTHAPPSYPAADDDEDDEAPAGP